MAGEHKEVRYLRLYLREPGKDRLRKTAAGWLRRMMTEGWRETSRVREHDYHVVRLDREGHKPKKIKFRPPTPPPPRGDRRGFGGPGRGFGQGRGFGGPRQGGGYGGPRAGGGPPPPGAPAGGPPPTPPATPS